MKIIYEDRTRFVIKGVTRQGDAGSLLHFSAVECGSTGHPDVDIFDNECTSEFDHAKVKVGIEFTEVSRLVEDAAGQRQRTCHLEFEGSTYDQPSTSN